MAVYVYRQASQTLKTSRIDARIDEAEPEGGEEVVIRFETGGFERATNWSVSIDTNSFNALALAMLKADKDRATKAFGKALSLIKLS